MFERHILVSDVRRVLETGDTISDYREDRPLPSRLVLGWVSGKPIHVVAADDPDSDITIVVTAYVPDLSQWHPDFRRRRR